MIQYKILACLSEQGPGKFIIFEVHILLIKQNLVKWKFPHPLQVYVNNSEGDCVFIIQLCSLISNEYTD